MNRTELQNKIKTQREELSALEKQLEDMPEVIEPVGGDWLICPWGGVRSAVSDERCRLACKEYTTKEEAKRAQEEDYLRDRIRNRRDQLMREGVGEGEEWDHCVYISGDKRWYMGHVTGVYAGLLAGPNTVMAQIANELNKGLLSTEMPKHMR